MREDRFHRLLAERLTESLRSGRPMRMPAGGEAAWSAFFDLSRTRGITPVGPAAITYAEIDAHARLMRLPLEPRHVRAIVALDRAFLAHARGKEPGATQVPDEARHGISPAAFDAVFG